MNYETVEVSKAEETEAKRLTARHKDIATHGPGALARQAEKDLKRQGMNMFALEHGLACFRCGSRLNDWAKVGTGEYGRAWGICVLCVRKKGGS